MIVDMDIETINLNYINGGFSAGELAIYTGGRQTGKSYYYQKILKKRDLDNLTKMFLIQPQSKYKFSRANWYVANFNHKHYFEVEEWCEKHFGRHPSRPDAWSRWVHKYEDQIHFRDEKDYVLFTLRWS